MTGLNTKASYSNPGPTGKAVMSAMTGRSDPCRAVRYSCISIHKSGVLWGRTHQLLLHSSRFPRCHCQVKVG